MGLFWYVSLWAVTPNKLKHQFAAEKSLLQDHTRKMGFWLMLKPPKLPDGFWGEVFLGKIWSEA